MQYKDTDEMPERRAGQPCLNCGQTWEEHSHWACSISSSLYRKSELSPRERYLTYDMQEDLREGHQAYQGGDTLRHPASSSKKIESQEEQPQWMMFRYNEPGHCFCGIVKSKCDYHRNT